MELHRTSPSGKSNLLPIDIGCDLVLELNGYANRRDDAFAAIETSQFHDPLELNVEPDGLLEQMEMELAGFITEGQEAFFQL